MTTADVTAQIAELRAAYLASPENVRMESAETMMRITGEAMRNGWEPSTRPCLAEREWEAAFEAWCVVHQTYREKVIALRASVQ